MKEEEIIEEIKLYARIDEDFGEVKRLKSQAESYLKKAGVKKDYEDSLYLLLIQMLVKHWYDNRGLVLEKSKENPYGIDELINQFQISCLGETNEIKR